MSDEQLEEIIDRADFELDRLKDRVHEQYFEIESLKIKIDKALEYIEENCGADNRLQLKTILKGE